MSAIEIIGSIFLTVLNLLTFWCIAKHQSNKNFQRFMQPGRLCWYYFGENREPVVIKYIFGNKVLIQDQAGDVYEVTKNDLYV
jgi:hypothetical protein